MSYIIDSKRELFILAQIARWSMAVMLKEN
jgi:hypothetical protein